jgi:hypothetical protein
MHSHLLVPAVLRPFGEHLAEMVQPRAGDLAVDLSGGDDAVMPSLLARRVQRCLAIAGTAGARSLPDGSAQVVTSLFTLAEQPDPVAALRELLRILDPDTGSLAAALWSEPGAVPHLDALPDAYRAQVAAATQFGHPLAAEHLVEQAGAAERIEVSRIHDVVRFDGVTAWWAAVAGGAAPNAVPATAQSRLAAYAVADGTLRIPTEALVLTITAAPPSRSSQR